MSKDTLYTYAKEDMSKNRMGKFDGRVLYS